MNAATKANERVSFYLGERHKDFLRNLQSQLDMLQSSNISWKVHEKPDLLLPEVCVNGYCVAGLEDIKKKLESLLSE